MNAVADELAALARRAATMRKAVSSLENAPGDLQLFHAAAVSASDCLAAASKIAGIPGVPVDQGHDGSGEQPSSDRDASD